MRVNFMKKVSFGLILLIFFLGPINSSFAQFQVGQKVKFKTFKKPPKHLCKYQIRQEAKLNDKDNDIDWEFDENECKILAVPPKAKPNTVVVDCSINARVTFLFGDYKTFNHTTKRPCIFPDINQGNIEIKK
jgi:hypothetical protein